MKKFNWKSIITILLLVVCSPFMFVGCIGSMGGGTSSGGDTVRPTPPEPKPEPLPPPDFGEFEETDYNKMFLGAIAVYDVDNNSEVFFDNFTEKNVDFNYLIDRQFNTLSSIIVESLNAIYGNGAFNGNIANYAKGNLSYKLNDIVGGNTIYNTTDKLKYNTAIWGNSSLVLSEITEEGEGGEPVTKKVFKYQEITDGKNPWKTTTLNANTIANDLKYIALNCEAVTNKTETDVNLQSKYSNFNNGKTISNDSFSSIGFDEDYIYNVMYYIAYNLIGQNRIEESIVARKSVFNDTAINTVDEINYHSFNNYKGYDVIIPAIVTNMFKIGKDNQKIIYNDYCFSKSAWSKTLFPSLVRNEYVLYENIEDIADAVDETNSKKDTNLNENGELDFSTSSKGYVGLQRKLKQIILIPKMKVDTNNKESKIEDFTFDSCFLYFATPKDTILINILVSAKDENKSINKPVVFSDNSFEIEGETSTSNKKGKSSLSKSGYYIVDNVVEEGKANIDLQDAQIFNKEDNVAFKDIVFEDGVVFDDNFLETYFNRETIKLNNNKILSVLRLKVLNNIFSYNIKNNTYDLRATKNYCKLDFEYYDKDEKKLDVIPDMYVMSFSIFEM